MPSRKPHVLVTEEHRAYLASRALQNGRTLTGELTKILEDEVTRDRLRSYNARLKKVRSRLGR